MGRPLYNTFANYHIVDLLRLATSKHQVSHLDAEEMQELIVELAERLEDSYERELDTTA